MSNKNESPKEAPHFAGYNSLSTTDKNRLNKENTEKVIVEEMEDSIICLKSLEVDLRKHVGARNETKICEILDKLLDYDINLDMIISNEIGKVLTKLKRDYKGKTSEIAGRLSNRWKRILLSSSEEEQERAVLKAVKSNWISDARAKFLLESVCGKNGGKERRNCTEKETETDEEQPEKAVEGDNTEEQQEVSVEKELESIEELPEVVVENEIEDISGHQGEIANQRIGMKDLPDHLVTKCGRAKICVDEGRIDRVQNKFTGTVCYNIEEGNKVFLVKTKIKDKKVEYECSCSVTGNCMLKQ
jgi:hypothetical protein